MRAFVAVRLSEASVKPLVDAQRRLEKAAPGVFRWTSLDSIHLTLYFLGEVVDTRFESIIAGLQAIQAEPFSLGWGGLVVLPSPDVPKILAAGVIGGGAALRTLQRKIHDAVFPLAENKETRAFFPHATFGRLKRGVPPSAKIVKRALAEFKLPDGTPEPIVRFSLMMSRLDSGGAQYEVVREFALEAPR